MINIKTKYFLYARKSSESEDRQIASIASQVEELKRLSADKGFQIVKVLKEERSAKAPGRPVFNKMIDDINNGIANGIICWKLDRLARNPIDGGTINWMLQQNIIKHIQTNQRSYYPEDNTLMMSLEFGMANQFILDLSENTKRGLRSKADQGWLPHKPPIGYLTNKYKMPDKPPIYKDEEKFHLVKRLWDILLTERCSIDTLYETARELKLKTSDRIIQRSTFYDLFRNPFYYGSFKWKGQIYPGKHEPMISKEQFQIAQDIIDKRVKPIKKTHTFAYTNLIRCGECGASITAENKVKHQKNGNVHKYTYYRCTKRVRIGCSQKPIKEEELERQALQTLERIEIPSSFHKWAIKQLKAEHQQEKQDRSHIFESYNKALNSCVSKLDTLFNMRLNNEISEDEYRAKKNDLLREKNKYEELLSDSNQRVETWLDRAESLFSFAETAKEEFKNGSPEKRRQILSCLGSNLILQDKKLMITGDNKIAILKDLAPEVRTFHSMLEPINSQLIQGVLEERYAQSEKWGARPDLNRRPLGPQPSALTKLSYAHH